MFKFLKQISRLLVVATMMCFVANADKTDKTMDDYSREANVFFDVKKIGTRLELIGREGGRETFRTTISNVSFSSFSSFSQGSFQLQKLQDELHWRYSPNSSDEFFEITVKQNGDIELGDLSQNYTGFDRYKTYAFRTPGTLENHGSQAFYNLVLTANQFHNFGTIQAYEYHFFHNYHFNSGVIKSGEIPKIAMDLRDNILEVTPSYKYGVVENYGGNALIGNLNINNGLNLINHGLIFTSSDLKMSGGDISSDKNIYIQSKLSGAIRDIKISSGICHVGCMEIEKLRNLIVESDGIFDLWHFGLKEVEAFIVDKEAVVRAIGEVAFAVTKTLDVKGAIFGTEPMMILSPKFLKGIEERRKKVDEVVSEIEKAQEAAIAAQYCSKRRRGGGLTFSFGVGTGGMNFGIRTTGYTPDFKPMEGDLRRKFGGPLYGTKEPPLKVLLEAKKEVIKNNPALVTPKLFPKKTTSGDSRELNRLQQSIKAERIPSATPSITEFYNRVAGGMKQAGVGSRDIGLIMREPSIEGALRELHREAEYGTAKERQEASTFGRLKSALDADEPDPIFSHPELLIQQVIPAARVTSVGAIALQRSIPKLVTATGVTGAFWRDMISHMKAKQEASRRSTAGGEPSKAGSSSSAPRAERVVPTQADQLKFSQQQRASGAWKNCESGGWQGSFESKKGDYRFTPTVEKWEFEVYKKVAKGWQHCGVMRAAGPEKGEILDRFAKGIIKK